MARRWTLVLCCAVVLLFTSCSSVPVSEAEREAMALDARETMLVTDCSRVRVTGATDDELRIMKDAFNGSPLTGGVPKAVQDAVKVIRIMRVFPADHFPENEPAHCERDDGMICVQEGRAYLWFLPYIVWHETGHAYEDWLANAHMYEKFLAFQRLIPPEMYGEEKYADTRFPYKGLISKHGARNPSENWAMLIQEVNACCNGYGNCLHQRGDDPALYRAELDALLAAGAISKAQYDWVVVLPLFNG